MAKTAKRKFSDIEKERKKRGWIKILDEFDDNCVTRPSLWKMFGPCRKRKDEPKKM